MVAVEDEKEDRQKEDKQKEDQQKEDKQKIKQIRSKYILNITNLIYKKNGDDNNTKTKTQDVFKYDSQK
uniref:Uncharacterized protein n=1 Tax=viral metagenome TaxID=1070528 RepID=A0A6C0HXU3_9ZZZZ